MFVGVVEGGDAAEPDGFGAPARAPLSGLYITQQLSCGGGADRGARVWLRHCFGSQTPKPPLGAKLK